MVYHLIQLGPQLLTKSKVRVLTKLDQTTDKKIINDAINYAIFSFNVVAVTFYSSRWNLGYFDY